MNTEPQASNPAPVPTLDAALLQHDPIAAARLLERHDPVDTAQLLDLCAPEVLTPVLERLPPTQAQALLEHMTITNAAAALQSVSLPRAAAFLRNMPEPTRQNLLLNVDRKIRQSLELLLANPANSAAAMMDPRVLHLRPSMLIQDALELLRRQHLHLSPTQARRILLLLDDERRIEGMVAIQDLALATSGEHLQDYMQSVPATVQQSATRKEILEILETHHVSSLPVVDEDQRLVGIVRHDELIALTRAGATGDIQAMFGVSRAEQALSPPLFSVCQRLPWLQINLITAFAAAAVVGLFESTIASYTALAILLPVVAGQSGNAGAQALAVVMRGLALREIGLGQWRRVLRKELLVALMNGFGVACTSALAVFIWSRSLGLTCILALAMLLSMAIAGLAGSAVPLVLTRLGQDPAQSSSIILTTVTDVAGFFSFLGIATLLMSTL